MEKPIPTPFVGSVKRDWTKIVSESNGTRIFVPNEFTKRVEEIEKVRKELTEMVEILAEKEIDYSMANQNMLYEIRKHLAKIGKPTWTKNIGLDNEALKEKIYILNILEPQK